MKILPFSGTQSVGKSMILNLIALNTPTNDLSSQILHYHETTDIQYEMNDVTMDSQVEPHEFGDVPENKKKGDNMFKFKMQDIEQIERGVHCTKGKEVFLFIRLAELKGSGRMPRTILLNL